MHSIDIASLVQMVIGLSIPLMSGVCGIVCLAYRRLSPWLTLVALGFLGEAAVGIAERAFAFWFFQISERPSLDFLRLYQLGSTLGYALAVALLTLGILPALGDISRRVSRLRDAPGDARDRTPAPEARETWRPRQDDSRDIQR